MRESLRASVLAPAGRLRTPWRLFVAGVVFLSLNAAVAGAALAAGLPVDPRAADGSDLAAVFVFLTVNGGVVAAGTLLVVRHLDRRRLADVGVRFGARPRLDALTGGLLGVGLVGGAYLAGTGLGVYEPRFDPAGPAGYPLGVWLALLAVTMVAVGLYEELLLRGYVLTNVAEGLTAVLGARAAVVGALAVSSAGFGLLHGTNPNATALGVATITLAGLLLGLGYACTGSLAFPVGVHVTWNLTHVLLGVPVSGLEFGIRLVETETAGPALLHGGVFGPEGGLLGLASTALGCLLVVAYARSTGRRLDPEIAVPALR